MILELAALQTGVARWQRLSAIYAGLVGCRLRNRTGYDLGVAEVEVVQVLGVQPERAAVTETSVEG